MSKKQTDINALLEPKDALNVYFDALLFEGDTTDQGASDQNGSDQDGISRVAKLGAGQGNAHNNSARNKKPGDNPGAVITPINKKSPEQMSLAVKIEQKITSVSPSTITYPDWGHSPFQCLTFKVGGITLAIPKEKVRGIIEIKEKITELPGFGCAPWLLGLFPCHGQNVQVVDIAQIVLPDRQPVASGSTSHWVNYLILVGGGRFGLAVEGLSTVLSLKPEDIRWRSEQDKRSWMAGTVVEHMCAMLDVDSLSEMLVDGLDLALNEGR